MSVCVCVEKRREREEEEEEGEEENREQREKEKKKREEERKKERRVKIKIVVHSRNHKEIPARNRKGKCRIFFLLSLVYMHAPELADPSLRGHRGYGRLLYPFGKPFKFNVLSIVCNI